jgi:selenocysteine lyase/cysteine desulfurase
MRLREEISLESFRSEFEAFSRSVYLDCAARTPMANCVAEEIEEYCAVARAEGARKTEWLDRVELVRAQMADFISASPNEIAFTQNTSDGVNLVAQSLRLQPGDNVVLCPELEHAANVYPWLNLERKGVEVKYIPFGDGRVSPEKIREAIDERTKVVTVSSVSFVTGARVDLREISEICRPKGIFLMVDGAQSLGIVPTDVADLGVDGLAASTQKGLLGVYGQGILYCRAARIPEMSPPTASRSNVTMDSAHESDLGDLDRIQLRNDAVRFETGNPNFIGIFALGRALRLLVSAEPVRIYERVSRLAGHLIKELTAKGYRVLTPSREEHRAGIVVFEHPAPDKLAQHLFERRIVVAVRRGRVRVSMHFMNNDSDLDQLLEQV